jgi:hypothetical protein
MNRRILFILLFLYSSKIYSIEVQYFISPYFYENPHSYSINGFQYYKYYPGPLLESAIKKTKKNYFKCNTDNKSDLILYLFPRTFYNPLMTTLYTDLNVRIFNSINKNEKNLLIKYENIVKLNQTADEQIRDHYSNLINKLDFQLSNINSSNKKIDGNFCRIFK